MNNWMVAMKSVQAYTRTADEAARRFHAVLESEGVPEPERYTWAEGGLFLSLRHSDRCWIAWEKYISEKARAYEECYGKAA